MSKNTITANYIIELNGRLVTAKTGGEALDAVAAAGACILSEDREAFGPNLQATGAVSFTVAGGQRATIWHGEVYRLTQEAAALFRANGKEQQMQLSALQAAPFLAIMKALQIRNAYGYRGTIGNSFSYHFPAERPGVLFNLIEDAGHVWLQGTYYNGGLCCPLLAEAPAPVSLEDNDLPAGLMARMLAPAATILEDWQRAALVDLAGLAPEPLPAAELEQLSDQDLAAAAGFHPMLPALLSQPAPEPAPDQLPAAAVAKLREAGYEVYSTNRPGK